MNSYLDLNNNYTYYGIAVLASYVAYKVLKSILSTVSSRINHNSMIKKGKEALIIRNKKADDFFTKHKKEISKEEIEIIVSLSLRELSDKIKKQEITSRKAYLCYALNSASVGKKLNGIADVNFEEGLIEAERADSLIQKCKDLSKLPPLIGVPITIKDHIPAKGFIDSCGYCSLASNISKFDSNIVAKLKEFGIIPICKSNVCQGLLSAESSNRVWGENKNIYDNLRTTGGSSGGEGSLISSYCSPAGIGSDVAGSVRIPANFNGIYGFKPTFNKIPGVNTLCVDGSLYSTWSTWNCCIGYLARNHDDLVFLSQILFGSFNSDEECFDADHRKFNENEFNSERKIKIGYFFNHKEVEPVEDIKKTILCIKDNLNKDKYEVVEVNMEKFEELYQLGYEMIINGDNIYKLQDCLKEEKPYYFYNDLLLLSKLPSFIYNKLPFIMNLIGEKRQSKMISNLRIHSTLEENYRRGERFFILKNEFLNYLRKENIESLVLPVYPFAAPKLGNAEMTNLTAYYNLIVSMCEMPSVALPTGFVQDNKYQTKFSDKLSKLIISDCKDSLEMPLGIQVASFPGKDEISLKISRDIDNLFKAKYPYNKINKDSKQTKVFWELRNN